jgi:hypothetical protein
MMVFKDAEIEQEAGDQGQRVEPKNSMDILQAS